MPQKKTKSSKNNDEAAKKKKSKKLSKKQMEVLKKNKWKKGQSGNPKGYPKGLPNLKTMIKRLMEVDLSGSYNEGIVRLNYEFPEMLEDKRAGNYMIVRLFRLAMEGNVLAIKEMNDRLEGKAKQPIGVELPKKIEVVVSHNGGKSKK